MTASRVNTVSWSCRDVDNWLIQRGKLISGVVKTPNGIVYVTSMRRGILDHDWAKNVTRFYFVWQAREYIRSYGRLFTPTGAARAAAQFAREVVDELAQGL